MVTVLSQVILCQQLKSLVERSTARKKTGWTRKNLPPKNPLKIVRYSPNHQNPLIRFKSEAEAQVCDPLKAMEWSTPTSSETKISEPTATSPPGGGSGAALVCNFRVERTIR